MKIAFVISKSEIGGAQSWVKEIAKLLSSQSKCKKIILITSDRGWLTECPVFNEVKIIPQILHKFSPACVLSIAKCLKESEVDVVVSSSANAGLYARLSKLLYKHNSIYVSHGWSCIYNGGRLKSIYCKIEQLLSKLSDTILCVSESDKIKAINILKIKPEKLKVILNAITPMQHKEFMHSKFEKKILFVGRLTYPKRPDLIADVVADDPNSTLHIIGGGDYLTEMKKKYSHFRNILFLGEVPGFKSFNNYDLFVLTSDSEGLPVSAIEAHTAGIPMILSNVGGCSELISDNGLLVDNSVSSVKMAVKDIFDNYDKYCISAMNHRNDFSIAKRKSIYLDLLLK